MDQLDYEITDKELFNDFALGKRGDSFNRIIY